MSETLRGFGSRRVGAAFLAATLILGASLGAWADQKKKKSKDAAAAEQTPAALLVPVSDQIDRAIGEMLGAFQIGDLETMHKYYADNATFVSGQFEPPVVGWQKYAPLYQRQAAQFQGMQLVRRNTYVFTRGDVAWATYEWEFGSMLNGQPYNAQGQTTLIFNKVGDNWLIVHNHTSQICPVCAQVPQQTPAAAPPAQTPPAR
jgi:ketosteroid isomerase-like protein